MRGVVEECKQEVVVFFFFQAEDGIRDDLVTGVQTCALPIYINMQQFHIYVVAEMLNIKVYGIFIDTSSPLGNGKIGRASCRERV